MRRHRRSEERGSTRSAGMHARRAVASPSLCGWWTVTRGLIGRLESRGAEGRWNRSASSHRMAKGVLVGAVVAFVSMPAHVVAASRSIPCPNTFHSPSGIADGSPAAHDVTLRNVRRVVAASEARLRKRFNAQLVAVGRYVGSVRDARSGDPQSVVVASHYAIDLLVPVQACPSLPMFDSGVPLYFYVSVGKASTERA